MFGPLTYSYRNFINKIIYLLQKITKKKKEKKVQFFDLHHFKPVHPVRLGRLMRKILETICAKPFIQQPSSIRISHHVHKVSD